TALPPYRLTHLPTYPPTHLLEHAPEILVGHLVVELDFGNLDLGSQRLGTPLRRGELEIRVALVHRFRQHVRRVLAALEEADGVVDVVGKEPGAVPPLLA